MKAVWSTWIWLTYCSISIAYYGTYGWIEPMYSKFVYLLSSIALLIYCIVQILKVCIGYNKISVCLCLSAIAANMGLTFAYHILPWDGYKFQICSLIFVEFITALYINISAKNHGLFKNESD